MVFQSMRLMRATCIAASGPAKRLISAITSWYHEMPLPAMTMRWPAPATMSPRSGCQRVFGYSRRNASQNAQCEVASRPSSRPVRASSTAPEQADATVAPPAWQARIHATSAS